LRRIRGDDIPVDEADSSLSSSEPNGDHPIGITGTFEPESLERRTRVEPERQDLFIEAPVEVTEPASGGEIASPAQIGEHVAAVIASAQQAAENMLTEAAAEAERIRGEARDEAKGLIAGATREAERMRADAGTYSREARHDADAYAGGKRGEADAYASRVRAEAEKKARAVGEAAKQEAKRIEQDAHRRREALTSEAERFEDRLQSLHAVFQGITIQLEALLPKKPEDAVEERDEETLDESLKRRVSA
jgi:cell division septum initiation protein DivIVA